VTGTTATTTATNTNTTATTATATTPSGTTIATSSTRTPLETLRRGAELSPELTRGIGLTSVLALVATAGRVIVPVAVQQTIDKGIQAQGGPRVGLVVALATAAALAVALTGVASYWANVRIFTATEAGLATLRIRAFRHIHDLSVLTQNTERRGSLVSRVTSDVDTISTFVQWGGLILVTSAAQLLIASLIMAIYSWQLTVLVWLWFLPLFFAFRPMQRVVSRAYAAVRVRVAEMLSAISECVVGVDTIRAYAVEDRTARRVDRSVEAHRRAAVRAQWLVATSFTSGVLVSGLLVAAVVVAGLYAGVGGALTLGQLLAFLFLVQLFVGPVQNGTEVLNELQNAVAGWRRVLSVLDTPADVADPGAEGVELPRGPIVVDFEAVTYAYPDGPPVLREVTLHIPSRTRVAVVGETGSGKSTLAKLLTRLMDPVQGRVLLDGVDLRRIRFASLRERVVMVPQEGFLVDDSLAANVAWGCLGATRDDVELALAELGLLDWALGLPRGLDTAVGQRGESLSAGERQLVALARAYLAGPDLLVLDEATSAVDPATEVRLQRALDGVSRGRTSVAIAHRLSTAEAADMVIVVEAGEVVDVGHHCELIERCAPYRRLHASWAAQHGAG